MRIVVAPLEFKGTLTAVQAAAAMAHGLREALPEASLLVRPMADGGPGTLEAMRSALGGELRFAPVLDPLGRTVQASWLKFAGDTAFVETAEAVGTRRVGAAERDPFGSSSSGVGQLVIAALEEGATRLFIGLGGSATNDGGRGMLEALGVGFEEAADGLVVDLSRLDRRLEEAEVIVLSDVTNPLLGENGATRVYGPQKGATEKQLQDLESRMLAFADACERAFRKEAREAAGAGAAGGLGFAFWLLGGRILPGAEVMIRLLGIDEQLKTTQALITGEGVFDEQSTFGKGTFALAELARRLHVPAYGIFGRVRGHPLCFERTISLEGQAGSAERAMEQATDQLAEAARRLGRETFIGEELV